MVVSKAVATLTCFLAIAAFAPTSAEAKKKRKLVEEHVVSIPHLLLPDPIADRIEGSGIECRSVASVAGARHKMQLGSLRLNLSERLALRGGLGMARVTPLPLAYEQHGLAVSAGVTYTLWRTDGYSADVDVAGLTARYSGGAMNDGSVLLMFRRRR
jgi:hypothetical protein